MFRFNKQILDQSVSYSARFFAQNNKLTPHTPEYLKQQIKFLTLLGRQAEIMSLKKDHGVVISNINSHHLIKDIIAYDAAYFYRLSATEYQDIKSRCDAEGSGLKLAKLRQDLDCVRYNSEHGCPIYYINHFKLISNLKSLGSFEDFIHFDRTKGLRP